MSLEFDYHFQRSSDEEDEQEVVIVTDHSLPRVRASGGYDLELFDEQENPVIGEPKFVSVAEWAQSLAKDAVPLLRNLINHQGKSSVVEYLRSGKLNDLADWIKSLSDIEQDFEIELMSALDQNENLADDTRKFLEEQNQLQASRLSLTDTTVIGDVIMVNVEGDVKNSVFGKNITMTQAQQAYSDKDKPSLWNDGHWRHLWIIVGSFER